MDFLRVAGISMIASKSSVSDQGVRVACGGLARIPARSAVFSREPPGALLTRALSRVPCIRRVEDAVYAWICLRLNPLKLRVSRAPNPVLFSAPLLPHPPPHVNHLFPLSPSSLRLCVTFATSAFSPPPPSSPSRSSRSTHSPPIPAHCPLPIAYCLSLPKPLSPHRL